jgi:anti-sigma regulatory factor (Ser/Thr protein kinase)
LPGDLDSLERLREFVGQVANQANINKMAAYRLALAVDEVATNIVVYGYRSNDMSNTISVWCRLDPDYLIITLEDTAPPFNPLERADPGGLDAPMEERPIGGLGVYLAIKGVDDFEYEYNDGKNINTFIVNRSPNQQDA